jgi:hypothetical protein
MREEITYCPDCAHPWAMHNGGRGGCYVGSQATPSEHCDCSRAVLLLPGETIDDAVARVGKLPEAEWRRLACGSQLRQQTLRMLRKHLQELQELTLTIGDVEAFWGDLQPEEMDAEVVSLIPDQSTILEQMQLAIGSLQEKTARLDRKG